MTTDRLARHGLPPWTYDNDELAGLENELVFRQQWLLVGHVNHIPNTGDYICLDEVDERAIVVRGEDGTVRAFHNLCRHRGSRIVDQDSGHAGRAITCPFHGWCYNLDGSLRGIPQAETFPGLVKSERGLIPVEMEIWHGLIFVRFVRPEGDAPSVAALFEGFDQELASFDLDHLQPLGWSWTEDYDVNWKSVMDVDNEGYHVPTAHPGLHALFATYVDENVNDTVGRTVGTLRESPSGTWTTRHYLNLLQQARAPHLSPDEQRRWTYYGAFPNLVITAYPDGCIDVYQTFPRGTQKAVMCGFGLGPATPSRAQRLLRYLKDRVDRETVVEDAMLIRWSHEAMRSSAFDHVWLSELEAGVMGYHDALRNLLPVMTLEDAPQPGTLKHRNTAMLG